MTEQVFPHTCCGSLSIKAHDAVPASVPLPEAVGWLNERNEWQYGVSDALDLTVQDHGRHHADLARCLTEIARLKAERDAGWVAAHARGRDEGIRQAVEWLRADYPYGSGPDWRENGAAWIEDHAAEERRTAAKPSSAPTQEAP